MFISEILPNPSGKDADGEWIEIFNDESVAVSLAGWRIKDASGKTFVFKNKVIKPGEYFILPYSESKISLNNNGERLELYNNRGALADVFEYSGIPSQGWSVVSGARGASLSGVFSFSDKPTPGAANITKAPEDYFSALLANGGNFSSRSELLTADVSMSGILFTAALLALALAVVGAMIISRFKIETNDDL